MKMIVVVCLQHSMGILIENFIHSNIKMYLVLLDISWSHNFGPTAEQYYIFVTILNKICHILI